MFIYSLIFNVTRMDTGTRHAMMPAVVHHSHYPFYSRLFIFIIMQFELFNLNYAICIIITIERYAAEYSL